MVFFYTVLSLPLYFFFLSFTLPLLYPRTSAVGFKEILPGRILTASPSFGAESLFLIQYTNCINTVYTHYVVHNCIYCF